MSFILSNIIIDYFLKGGPIMWPILLAFLAAMTAVIQRTLWWLDLRRRLDSRSLHASFDAIAEGRFDPAVELTDKPEDPFFNPVHTGVHNAHSSLLGAMRLR